MAQEVGWFENNVTFLEGPFVISDPMGNGWRIESELEGYHCPVLPDTTIFQLMENEAGWIGKTIHRERAECVCDWLNLCVKRGQIIKQGKAWICPKYEVSNG